jgi:beta-1,4-mannooligosaccharide/beta-1,4-mannosyl-N-acetylglucosamine phosphorylase
MPLVRHPENPILTRADIPTFAPHLVDVSSVFNPGAVRFRDRILLLLRVQNRGRETFLLRAESDDGVRFLVRDREIVLDGIERVPGPVFHVYDPRITPLEGAYFVTVALDTTAGCRVGVARTEDFESFEFLGSAGDDDQRNGVLFPARIGGRYAMLTRPNRAARAGAPTTGETITLVVSDDLRRWDVVADVAHGRPHYWDEWIGPGPPPLRTRDGWLLAYHGVATHFAGVNIYQAGLMLLGLVDPSRVLARTRWNCLEPREPYECTGQVPNVVFPSGWVAEKEDAEGFVLPESRVLLYYGAADTCVGLATATVGEMLAACRAGA